MEDIDQPKLIEDTKQEQVVINSSSSSSDDDDDDQKRTGGGDGDANCQVVVRSYDCTFCRRGFSNAQALGGHMNIHRKDKAKLKQYSSSSSSSVGKHNEDTSKMMQWRRVSLGGDATDDHDTTTQQFLNMPLFVSRSATTHQGQDKISTTSTSEVVDKDYSPSSGLDLELRLGRPDPNSPHHDSSTTGTRKSY